MGNKSPSTKKEMFVKILDTIPLVRTCIKMDYFANLHSYSINNLIKDTLSRKVELEIDKKIRDNMLSSGPKSKKFFKNVMKLFPGIDSKKLAIECSHSFVILLTYLQIGELETLDETQIKTLKEYLF